MVRNKIMAQLRDWKVLMTDEYTVKGVKKQEINTINHIKNIWTKDFLLLDINN